MSEPSLPGPTPALPAGYDYLDNLGRGGLGAVFKARHRATGRIVAIKTVGQSDDRMQALLMREARLLRSVSHPGIVKVHEVLVADDRVFVVQDYIDGQPLGEWQATASLPEVLRLYEDVARALAVLHRDGLVHRDLKPSNVMVTRFDERPVLLDFGLAVRSREPDSLTAVGSTVAGTPVYMSPEIIEGRAGGPASDVFALGVMLAEAISRRRFWDRTPVAEILMRRLRDSSSDVLARVPEVTAAGLGPIVGSMIAREPEERPLADAVAEALSQHRTMIGSAGEVFRVPPAPSPAIVAPAPGPTVELRSPVPVGIPTAMPEAASPREPRIAVLIGLAIAGGALALLGFFVGVPSGIVLVSAALVVVGSGLAVTTILRRREKRRDEMASMQAVAHRINAIEAQVTQAGEMTRTMAIEIDHIGQQVSPERLQEVIRQTVLVALRELQPAANAETESKRARELLEARPRSLVDRMKEYSGIATAGVTIAAGVVGLLSNTDMWRPNRAPEIVRLGSDGDRLRRGQPFMLPVEVRDDDGDDLTFTWKTSAGQLEGSGATAMWVPPPDFRDRVVSVTLTISDGTRAATRTRTIRVNEPPRGDILIEGTARPGRVVRLAVQAADPDGDTLQYNWVVSRGTLSPSSGSMVLWTVPASTGEAQALCQVSDGYETVSVARVIPIRR